MVVLVSIILFLISINRVQFEYYFFFISSEQPSVRLEYAEKVVEMGESAIPLLINRLYEPKIFEEKYIFICLEKIAKVKYPPNILKNEISDKKKAFWFNWYENYEK